MTTSIQILPSSNKGKTAWVRVTVGELTFDFSRDSASTEDAAAVVDYLQRAVSEQIRQVREVEYERGHRHGRRKTGKNPTNSSTLYIADWMKQ